MALSQPVVQSGAQPSLDFLSTFGNAHLQFDHRYRYSTYTTVYPDNLATNNARFSFDTSFGPSTMDLQKIVMITKLSLTKADGSKLDQNTKAAPCSNLASNLWKSLRMYVNNVNIVSIENYPVYCMMQALTESTQMDIDSHLRTALYVPDSVGHYDECSDQNLGYLERRSEFGVQVGSDFIWDDEEHCFISLLRTPLCPINYLPHPSSVKLDLARSPDSYVLMAENDDVDIKVNITHMELRVLTHILQDSLFLRIEDKLAKESLKYYFSDVNCSIFSIGTGQSEHIIENLSVGVIPTHMYLLIQEASVGLGQLSRNSMRFPRIFQKPDDPTSACALTSCRVTLGDVDVDGLYCPSADAKFSLNYFKFFLLNKMLTGGMNIPPALSRQQYAVDQHFQYYDFTASHLVFYEIMHYSYIINNVVPPFGQVRNILIAFFNRL